MSSIRTGHLSPQAITSRGPEPPSKPSAEAVWARVSQGLFRIASAATDPQARSAAQHLATQTGQALGPALGQLSLGMRLSSLSEEDSLLNPHPLLQEPEKLGMKREADQGAEGESGGMVVEDVDTPETPDLSLIPEVHAIDKQDRAQLGLKTRQVETIDQQAGPVLATEPDEQLEPWWIALHAYAGKPWPVGRQARPQPRLDEVRLDVSIHAWLTTVLQISKLEGWLPSAQPWRLLKPQDCSVQSAVAQSGIIVSLQDANPGHLQAAQEQILWGLVRVNDEHWALELASLGGERSIKLPHSADPFAWLKHQVQVMLNKPLALWRWAQR